MDRCVRSAAQALLVIVGIAADAASQGNTGVVIRSADVTTVTGPIEIDGSLNEAGWRSAPKIGDLVHAVRVAVTGKAVGFGLFEALAILGRDRCERRIARALRLSP